MLPSLPVEIWNMIFSHFISGVLRLQIKDWHDGRPSIIIYSSSTTALVQRFLATFVTKNCSIKGLHHAAMRFLMTHNHTVWMILTPIHVEPASHIRTSRKQLKPARVAIEHLAMLEDVFKTHIRAVQVAPLTLSWISYDDPSRVIFDSRKTVLITTIQRLPNLKTLDYTMFPAPAKRPEHDSRLLLDLKHVATYGHLAFHELKLVKCHSNLCHTRSALPIRFQLEDAYDVGVPGVLSVLTTKDSTRRVVTKVRCNRCGQVLSK